MFTCSRFVTKSSDEGVLFHKFQLSLFRTNRMEGCFVYTIVNKEQQSIGDINLLLTERKGRTGEYCPEVVALRTERSEVCTKTTEGQYSPVRLELARLVSSLSYLALEPCLFWIWKNTADDRFHRNGPYGEMLTKKEPIRTLGFTLPNNKVLYFSGSIMWSSLQPVLNLYIYL